MGKSMKALEATNHGFGSVIAYSPERRLRSSAEGGNSSSVLDGVPGAYMVGVSCLVVPLAMDTSMELAEKRLTSGS